MNKQTNDINTFILNKEQPATCPECGGKTIFNELIDGSQVHVCINPLTKCLPFIGEFESNPIIEAQVLLLDYIKDDLKNTAQTGDKELDDYVQTIRNAVKLLSNR